MAGLSRWRALLRRHGIRLVVYPLLVAGLLLGWRVCHRIVRLYQTGEWRSRSVGDVLKRYEARARTRLEPRLAGTGVSWPPGELLLVAIEESKQLEMWTLDDDKPVFLASYLVQGASGGLGPKRRQYPAKRLSKEEWLRPRLSRLHRPPRRHQRAPLARGRHFAASSRALASFVPPSRGSAKPRPAAAGRALAPPPRGEEPPPRFSRRSGTGRAGACLPGRQEGAANWPLPTRGGGRFPKRFGPRQRSEEHRTSPAARSFPAPAR